MSSLQMADQLVAMWLEDRKQAHQWVYLNCEGPRRVLDALEKKYPGIKLNKEKSFWHIFIPDELRIGHEAHFSQVLERYLNYLVKGELPEWEIPNMIAKYYTTTKALEIATNR